MTITSLTDVLNAIELDDRGKWDLEVPLRSLKMDTGSTLHRGKGKRILSSHAVKQLCNRVIPHNGGAFVASAPPNLRKWSLNYYLPRKRETCLLRGKGSFIRGILSQDYAIYNNAHLAETVHQVFANTLHSVKGFYLSPESLWLTITVPKIQVPDLGGLSGGVRLGNSEVGLRSLVCYAFVWRQVCKNGLVGWSEQQLLRQVHRGKFKPEELSTRLAEAVAKALDKADDLLDRLVQASHEPLPNLNQVVERIVKRRHLTEEFKDAIYAGLYAEARYAHSLFGLVNAMTRAAQLYQGDRRVQMEREAGRLLNWQEDEIYSKILKEGKIK